MDELKKREILSDLADGRLQGEAFAQGVLLASGDRDARQTWLAYHVIGDALRDGALPHSTCPVRFMERLQERLRDEDVFPEAETVVARLPRSEDGIARSVADIHRAPAANDPWRWVAVCASFTAVAALGWAVFLHQSGEDAAGQGQLVANGNTVMVAGAPPPGVAAPDDRAIVPVSIGAGPVAAANGPIAGDEAPQYMIRDPHLDELLGVHQQFRGATALQMPAGNVRSTAFEAEEQP